MTQFDNLPPHRTVPTAGGSLASAAAREPWEVVSMRHLEMRPIHADRPEPARMTLVVHLGTLLPADVCVEARPGAAAASDVAGTEAWPIRLCSAHSYKNGTFVYEAQVARREGPPLDAIVVRVRGVGRRGAAAPPDAVSRSFRLREGEWYDAAAQ